MSGDPSPTSPVATFDVAVIGSGPAGLAAAGRAAKAGRTVLLVEQEKDVGGACVHRGTIPSKTLRETALSLRSFQRRSGGVFKVKVSEELQVSSLMTRMEEVVKAHERYMSEQLERAAIVCWHGRAKFVDPMTLDVLGVDRSVRRVRAKYFCIATGSRPRTPDNVAVDHEHILDSDSILSMIYLPRSLVVLGGGVIASEYASIFAALGTRVTLIDSKDRPLAFLDTELTDRFLVSFAEAGGTFLGGRRIESVRWDGVADCITRLSAVAEARPASPSAERPAASASDPGARSFEEIASEKVLCCLGRVANVEGLAHQNAGVAVTAQGLIQVDLHLRTSAPHVYAIGDVIGPPSLASTSLEQGRRAICHAFDLVEGTRPEHVPMGIYTIPEISSVGLSESEAVRKHGSCVVGRARFDQVARGQIGAITDGLLKLVADPQGKKLLGVQIVGEGASDQVHVGQMALIAGMDVDVFVENTFNFPTLAEAYRIAAIDIVFQREARAGHPVQSPPEGEPSAAGFRDSRSST